MFETLWIKSLLFYSFETKIKIVNNIIVELVKGEDLMEKLVNLRNKFLYYFLKFINIIRNSSIAKIIVKRWKISLIILLGIFLIGGYFAGSVNSTKDRVIGKLGVALKEGDTSKLSKIVRLEGKKVDNEQLKPLIAYYKVDSSRSDNVVRALKGGGKTEAFNLESEKSLFGTDYYISLNTYKLEVTSNFNEGLFTVDKKEYINGGNMFDKLIPGVYSVEGKLESKFGNLETSKEMVLMKDDKVDMDFSAINVKVESKYKDSDIYVNGENTKYKVKDAKEMGPFPTDGSVSINIENNFPWGKIKSEEVHVSNTPNINIDINMENEKMKSDIEEVSGKFYDSVFKALNEKKKEVIEEATKEAKDKIYDVLQKKYFLLDDKYEINNINIDDSKSKFDYKDGVYKGTLVVNVNYKIKKSFLGIGVGENSSSKMFLTKFTYNSGKWSIEDVENFSL